MVVNCNFKAMNNYIQVRPPPQTENKEVSKSGLLLPENDEETNKEYMVMEVLSVAKGLDNFDLMVGDLVVFKSSGLEKFEFDGKEYMMVSAHFVMGGIATNDRDTGV